MYVVADDDAGGGGARPPPSNPRCRQCNTEFHDKCGVGWMYF